MAVSDVVVFTALLCFLVTIKTSLSASPALLLSKVPLMKKLLATSIAVTTTSLGGNIGAALQAVLDNPEAITCTLDTQQADENHGSCQLLDNIVRVNAGKVLTIKQDWGGSASTGAAVWNGANMAAWYMENVIGRDNMKGASILELGAGVGYTSLVANALGAGEVVISDGNTDVLKLADQNIALNVPEAERSKIRTAQLRWNTDDEEAFKNRGKPWDYIIAADVTYLKKNRPDLLASIAHLSGKDTVALVSMEPRNVDEVEDVLRTAEKQGFQWTEEKLPIDPEKEQCNLLCARMFKLKLVNPPAP